MQNRDNLAEKLLAVRTEGQTLTPPSADDASFDLEAAYRIGSQLTQWQETQGYHRVGRKVGLTNKSTWSALGLDTPIWAYVYEQTVHYAEDNHATFSLQGRTAPRLEPEIVFKLKGDIDSSLTEAAAIAERLEWFALGFEIVDCHYPDWKFKPADAVADFGLHAGLIIGTPQTVTPELVTQLAELSVTLERNNEEVAQGSGKNVLDNPLLALRYVANILKEQAADAPLRAGEVITTGTMTAAHPVAVGETWVARATGLPELTVRLE